MSIRPEIEAALSATAERLSSGSGADTVHHLKNDIAMIDASSENLSHRFAHDDVAIATPAVFETKHPEGDPVSIGKRHDGLIAVFPDSLLYVHAIGFGAREVKTLHKNEISAEPITMVLDGASVPGLRVTDHRGKPKFAIAIALPSAASDPVAQAAVRDEVCTSLHG